MSVIVAMIGMPGSGKGTLAKWLVEKSGLNVGVVSVSDLLRKVHRAELEKYSAKGLLVPCDRINQFLVEAIHQEDSEKITLVDGACRTINQARYFHGEEIFGRTVYSVWIDISEELARIRIRERANKESRADDRESKIVNRRIEVFKEETLPAINWIRRYHPDNIIRVNGSSNDVAKKGREIIVGLKVRLNSPAPIHAII